MGFVAGAIIAVVYNLLAGKVGGVEFELVERTPSQAKGEDLEE